MKLFSLLLSTASAASALASTHVSAIRRDNVAAITETPTFTYKELWDLQTAFYDKFMYPNNVAEAKSINSTVFSDNVLGRVSDTRTFDGRELNTEYIFGLFTPFSGASIIGTPSSYDIVQFTANQNIASASTRVNLTFASFGNISFPITIDTWITWNSDKQISQYDVTFRWFGYFLQTLVSTLDSSNATHAAELAVGALATSICNTHTSYCNGTNSQYASNDACMQFVTQEIRVGQSFELGMNTLMCRAIHMVMVQFRPEVHCPHIGPSGGGMCVDDESYVFKVTENYFANAPFIPAVAA